MMQRLQVQISATAIAAALLATMVRLDAQPLTITHLAGSTGGPGWYDGMGSGARFQLPGAVVADAFGNPCVADTESHTIRKIVVATGEVSTLAGLAGSEGTKDGVGSAARLSHPRGVTVDGAGNVYATSYGDGRILRIAMATGEVTTLASVSGPWGIAADGAGSLFVASYGKNQILRVVIATGQVSTLAGWPSDYIGGFADGIGTAARFDDPTGLAVDGSGNVWVADTGNHRLRKIMAATGEVTTPSLTLSIDPKGVAADGLGNLFATESSCIRKIVVATGEVTTLAGSRSPSGSADGVGTAAQFEYPQGVAADTYGNLFVADTGNHAIRRIVVASQSVTTIAGSAPASGSADGVGSAARFDYPGGVAADGAGHLYVSDMGNDTIRKIVLATRSVTTLAGKAGYDGTEDGIGSAARFWAPAGMAVDGAGNLYVAERGNHTIRKIVLATGQVTTLAGRGESYGSVDGIGAAARFAEPSAVSEDGAGNLYVADTYNNAIRKVVLATGQVTTLAGKAGSSGNADGIGSAARFSWPYGVAADRSGNVYVADYGNHRIRKIVAATGEVTTLEEKGGGIAGTYGPHGIALDGSGNVYVTARNISTIRSLVLASGFVTTVAGNGQVGSADGTGTEARFSEPSGMTIDPAGTIWIADTGNSCIRKGTLGAGLADAATIDAAIGLVGETRKLDTSPRTATRWLWEQVRRPTASLAALSSTTIRDPTFTPDLPDTYIFRLTASDGSGAESITTVSLTAVNPPAGFSLTRLLPIVLDVSNGSTRYTTEMSLTNNGTSILSLSLRYTASLGSRQGSGTVTDFLAPGQQKQVADVLSYLRERGLAIPSSSEQPSQGGTLLVTCQGDSTVWPQHVSVTARTAASTTALQPVGRAGLAYSGLLATESSTSSLTLYGLRSTPNDRTNVAVFNTSADPVTLKVTVTSGTGDGRSVVFRPAETLPPYGWLQYGSAQILDENAITKGWAVIEQTSTRGSFGAYAVINDSTTNDGSFLSPVRPNVSSTTLAVPVLTETPTFRSELILANRGRSPVALVLSYTESLTPSAGTGGSIDLQLGAQEELIIPEAVDYLRSHGIHIGPRDAAPYVGSLRIRTASGASIADVFAGARTASQSPAGGQFGLFTPGVYQGQEASGSAYIYGLRSDSENRSNVAVVHTGDDSRGPILLYLQAFDGDAGGVRRGDTVSVSLSPGQWAQPVNFFKDSGVANGWVMVWTNSYSSPWIAYGVVNDGGNPGERTGDGAYVPMVK